MMSDLLSGLDITDVELFQNDFRLLMKLAVEIDKEYGLADNELTLNLPTYEEYIRLFNKKYSGIKIMPSESYERRFLPEIYIIREKTVKDTFFNSALKIHKVKAISSSGCLRKDATEDENQFKKEVGKLKNKICIQYYGIKSPTLLLSFSLHRKMVEIIYDSETVCDVSGPEFKIIAYYAIKDSDIDYNIELKTLGESFTTNVQGVDSSMGGRAGLR